MPPVTRKVSAAWLKEAASSYILSKGEGDAETRLMNAYDKYIEQARYYESLAATGRNLLRVLNTVLLLGITTILTDYADPFMGENTRNIGVAMFVVVGALRLALRREPETTSTRIAAADACRKLADLAIMALGRLSLNDHLRRNTWAMFEAAERLFAPRELR